MLKAEIVTDVFDYTVDIPEEHQTTLDAWKYVKDAIGAGMPLEGEVLDKRCAFSIEQGSSIKHIRIYDDAAEDPKVAAPDPTAAMQPQLPTNGFWHEEFLQLFAGQKVTVKVACYAKNKHLYLMPVSVNDTVACDMMGADNLKKVTEAWAKEFNDGLDYEIIISNAPLVDHEEIKAYIVDYAEWVEFAEKDPAIDKHDAKAWQGWKER